MAAHPLHPELPAWFTRIFPVVFTLVAGTALTLFAFNIIQKMERERVRLDFEAIALNKSRTLSERVHSYEESLYTLRNLFVASEHVSQPEFELVGKELRGREPGVNRLQWLPFVTERERPAIESAAKAEVHPGWTVTDGPSSDGNPARLAKPRNYYLPALYSFPKADPKTELGVDQLIGPHQRAIQRAIESGEIAATRRVVFDSGEPLEFGWVSYLAVYKDAIRPRTTAERWANVRGVLRGEFRFKELFAVDVGGLNYALQIVLTDETPGTTEPYLLNYGQGTLRGAPPPLATDLRSPMKVVHTIHSAGRLWRVHTQPDDNWIKTKRTGLPYVVLAFGLWLTAFLAASIDSSRRRTETVNRLVATRTAQLHDVEEQLRDDIRRRKEAEERYHAFVQQSTEAIWRFELDEPMPVDWPEDRQVSYIHQHAYLAECNDECARMYGYDRSDEMIGMRLTDLMPLEDPRNREHLETFVQQGFRLFDSESHEADRFGKIHIILNNAVGIVENGKFIRGWGTQRDVTEQRRLERERLADADRLRVAIEAANLGLWEWDPVSDKLTWNDVLLEMHGLTREEFAGNYEVFAKMLHHDDRERMENEVKRALEVPGSKYESEYRIVRRDESERWIYTRGYVRRDENGKPIGVLGAAIDITSRKQAQVEREAMEQKLQDTQKLESLGILAGGIAHDFNNLLTGVLGNASLAMMDLPDKSPVQPYLRQIEQSAQRAADLCRQMLAYSGKGRFVVQRVSLSDLVEESAALLQVSITKDAVLKLKLTNPLPAVNADATQLRQILMNLVINASDAIGNRPGVIEIKTGVLYFDSADLAATHLSPDLPSGSYVSLEVSDTGAGMDAETQKRIFDPFFTTKFTGRGLGLAAVLGIVRSHHGALKVVSEPGRGSTFTLLLPEVEGEPDQISSPLPTQTNLRGKGRVLVIDDEASVRSVTTKMLKTMGLECVAAVDGRQGLDLFTAHPDAFQLVLLDLTMPRMDGAQALAELRRLHPEVPVVLMSGYTEQDAAKRVGSEKVSGFIQKPFQPEQLQEVLRRAFEDLPHRA